MVAVIDRASPFVIMVRTKLKERSTRIGWILTLIVNPVFAVATACIIFSVVTTGAGGSDEIAELLGTSDYAAFLAWGAIVMNFLLAALWDTGTSIEDERVKGTLETIFLSPVSRSRLILAQSTASILTASLVALYILAMATFVFGLEMFGGSMAVASGILALGLTILSMMSVGYFFASFYVLSRAGGQVARFASVPIIFFSGINYPVQILPPWARTISSGIPVTYGLRAVRAGFLEGAKISQLWGDLVLSLLFAAVFFAAGYSLLRVLETVVRKEGRLGFY